MKRRFVQTVVAGLWVIIPLLLSEGRSVAASTDFSAPKGVVPQEVELDNGLKLLLIERREQPMVACGVFYDVGAVDDPRGQSGMAHLFEHMLFKGTKVIGTADYEAERTFMEQKDRIRAKMNEEMDRMRLMKRRGEITDVLDPAQWTPEYQSLKKQYDELLAAQREYIKNNELFNLYTTNGGRGLNAATMHDATFYFVQLPANKIELFFWLESDRMVNGIMREFYVERDNVREERRLRVESTPTGKYDEAFNAQFWQAHPYGVPVLGWPSEVESITREDADDFYRTYYAPNNARVVVVGDFDTEEVVSLAKRYFGRISRGTRPRPMITEEPPPVAHRRFYAEAETNPRLRLRFLTVAIGHKDEAALDVLSGLLSGKTGRLYRRLVTEEDVAIGMPRASNMSRKYAGHLEINVTVKQGRDPEEVEPIVLEEIEKLFDGDITDRELQRVKNQVLAGSVRRLQSNTGLMFQLGLVDTFYQWQHLNEAPQRMLKITADGVRRVARQYLDPETRTVAIYRTKEVSPTPTDPGLEAVLAGVPEERRENVRRMIEHIHQIDNRDQLAQQATMMEQALSSGQIPEEQRRVFEYMVEQVRARLTELQAETKESDE